MTEGCGLWWSLRMDDGKGRGEMKRRRVENAGAPEYPTFRDYHKNRRVFLRAAGMGVAGMALVSCKPIYRTSGIVSMPSPPQTSEHSGDGQKGATCPPNDSGAVDGPTQEVLGGVPPLPEKPEKPDPPKSGGR